MNASWRPLSLLCTSLLALTACSARPPYVAESPPKVADRSAEAKYREVFDRFTSHREIYKLFDTRLFGATTYQSEAFRRAKAIRRATFERMPDATYQKLLTDELAEAKARHSFWFGAHLNDPKFDDFDRRESVWRVLLVTPAGEFAPESIERVGRAWEPMRAYYPYMDTFWTAYRFHFPVAGPEGQPTVPEGTEKLILRVSSSLGQTDFEVPAR